MSHGLAHRLSVVVPSVTLAVNAKAAALRAKGVDVFGFGVGEPDFDPPATVLEAAKRAIDSGAHKYTPVTGIPALKKAIADDHKKRRGQEIKPENVCVSVGAKHALFNVALALYEPG
ncbi:MAG TPA: aminotransferase class I/II-fold pyridoxal phosphate-dependent enzyme, partial [Polyangiaceae bacterium]